MNIIIEDQKYFEQLLRNQGINLLLGSAFSAEAISSFDDKPMPLGNQFKLDILQEFQMSQFEDFSLGDICKKIKNSNKANFDRFVRKRLDVKSFPDTYNVIDLLKIKNIFSINLDNLLEKIFDSSRGLSNILYDAAIIGNAENEGINLFKMHGSITYPYDKPLRFTKEELSEMLLTDPSLMNLISLKVAYHPTLIWGTSVSDANILNVLYVRGQQQEYPSQPKWIIIPHGEKHDKEIEIMGNDFKIIRADTKAFLAYLHSLLNHKNQIVENESSNKYEVIFEKEYFQNLKNFSNSAQYPVRPISFFLTGEEASWNEIFNNKIPKLSMYKNTLSLITKNANNMYMFTGCIASGKSTLLKQLFVSDEIIGQKFFFQFCTLEQARKLFHHTENEKENIFIFIDDATNCIEAINFLFANKRPNFKFILSAVDINYELTKHKLPEQISIFDITELSKEDIQAVKNFTKSDMLIQTSDKTSLFEITYELWTSTNLENKIQNLIQHLSSSSSELLEFFTLLSYIRYCHVLANMDMLLLYYTDSKKINYKTIYTMADNIKNLIIESNEPIIASELNQDLYTVRSLAIAEKFLSNVSSDILAKVLTRFSENVHQEAIYRFDVFRIRAYDADLTKKAFSNIEDGKKFYKNLILQDNNPYKIQQFALYLERKGDLKEAWEKIDEAMLMSKNRIMVISNTHAYILFKMNINKPEDGQNTVKKTIDSTFTTLEKCLENDGRKTYHATIFAEHALAYYKRCKDHNGSYIDEAKEYLDKAYKYIDTELNQKKTFITKGNLKRLKQLLKQVHLTKRSFS